MADNDRIDVESGVSVFSGEPFVTMRWGRSKGQLSPEEAIKHAEMVIGAAAAATVDAAVWAELTSPDGLELPKGVASAFMAGVRARVSKAKDGI